MRCYDRLTRLERLASRLRGRYLRLLSEPRRTRQIVLRRWADVQSTLDRETESEYSADHPYWYPARRVVAL